MNSQLHRLPAVVGLAWLALVSPIEARRPSALEPQGEGATAGCVPDWLPTFGGTPGTDAKIYALAAFDDGSGPALFAAGDFTTAGSQPASLVAKWDGANWSGLGAGLGGPVWADSARTLAVFDDGSGPALFVGGNFMTAGEVSAPGVARWDGQQWSAVGTGIPGTVHALFPFDDGSGPALYAGGEFTLAGGAPANRIARWDGQSWSTVGGGMDAPVYALAAYDDGGGLALHAGGSFTTAGGSSASGVARWDGQGWSALGAGVTGSVRTLATFDDGSGAGEELYVGGNLIQAGGVFAQGIARWDGAAWRSVGGGLSGWVLSLLAHDDGSGPRLFVAGSHGLLAWDGQGWDGVGLSSMFVRALAAFDDGSGAGANLFAGGDFLEIAFQDLPYVGRWDGQSWKPVGAGLNGDVLALATFDDGSGPALYAGGEFTTAGGQVVNGIARWAGQAWSPLGSGADDAVHALAVFDDGSGPALFAGGEFWYAGQAKRGVAKWDGASWSPLGDGVNRSVFSLAVFDDGSGPALFVGGDFTLAGGQSALGIAKWDGLAWSALGEGLAGKVSALEVFDDGLGGGPALYANGHTTLVPTAAYSVARWDGAAWTPLGGGMNDFIEDLAVFDDGSGPALFAGGGFDEAGGQEANRIAKWDGSAWYPLGGGLNHTVHGLAVFDDGSGPALFAGGSFTSAGGVAANRIARWDGLAWSAISNEMNATVRELHAHGDASGPALYAGGEFDASAAGDAYLARWGCASSAVETLPGCFGNPATLAALSGELKIAQTFSVSLSSVQLTSGFAALFLGVDGTDAAGCGVFVPGIGELLLAIGPAPAPQLASGPLSSGAIQFDLPVPNQPSFVGAEIALHGAILGVFDPGGPIELSNGLVTVIAD